MYIIVIVLHFIIVFERYEFGAYKPMIRDNR